MFEDFLSEFGSEISQELADEAEDSSMILLLGETGAGKSHFINTIAPGRCKESSRLESCTTEPAAIDVRLDGKLLFLIDTPGFNDTKKNYGRSDAVILSEIARLIAAKSALGIKMRGVIYLHDINLPRMTGEAVRQLILLQKISGKQNWKSITFVTTKWPELAHQQKYNLGVREADLRREHWRIMIRNGAKVFRFTDTVESAEVIVRSLMQQDDVLFTIQQEMKQGQSLANTSAGKFVIEARQEDEKRHSEMSEELKNEAGNQRLSMDIASLQGSIKNRKNGEENLDEHVQAAVEHEIKIKVEEELKKNGRRPTLATIVQFLLTLGSFTANIVQSAIS